MEFAEESLYPFSSSAFAYSAEAKMRFTPVWQSSKFPRTAITFSFSHYVVHICRFCIFETPSSG